MTFPPESPQDYCDYFQALVAYGKHPEPQWEIGLAAAQVWRDYWKGGGEPDDIQALISIVKILMPVRLRGSVLLDLWQRILRHVAKLPVSTQRPIWLEVFNAGTQGIDPVKHNEAAVRILQEWIELEKKAEVAEIGMKTMLDMADKIYKYALNSYDWIAFTIAMSEWFKNYIDEPSFYDVVCDRFGKKPHAIEDG